MSILAQLNGARQLVRREPAQFPTLVRQVIPVADRPEVDIRRWCAGFVVDFLSSLDVTEREKLELGKDILGTLDLWLNDSDPVVLKYAITALSLIFPVLFGGGKSDQDEQKRSDTHGRLMNMKAKAFKLWDSKSTLQGVQESCIKFGQVVVIEQSAKPLSNYLPGVMDPVMLNAEAAGLLDRLLGYFTAESFAFQQLSATLNCVLPLVKIRPQWSAKIFHAITQFDLSRRQINSALVIRWTAKLFQVQLGAFARQNPPLQQYIKGLTEYCANTALRKRAAESAGISYEDHPSKRAKKTLPEGEVHYSELYRLVDTTVATFNARDLQMPLAVSMAIAGLNRVDPDLLADCLDVVRDRSQGVVIAPQSTDEADQTPQVENDQPASLDAKPISQAVTSGDSKLEASLDGIAARILSSDFKLFVRLAARGVDSSSPASKILKEKIYSFVMADFRQNLDSMVEWLSEEWFASHVLKLQDTDRYSSLVGRIIDQIVPRLEASPKDTRVFIRLLSEIPELSREAIWKIRSVLVDPERSTLGSRAIKFLVMFKPPVKEDCLDLLQDVTKEEKIQGIVQILQKYRPQSVE